MMNRIWAFLIIISFVCAVATGRMEALSQGILEGTGSAVNLVISTMGMRFIRIRMCRALPDWNSLEVRVPKSE